MRVTNDNIRKVFFDLSSNKDRIEWFQIVEAINASGMRIKNWMIVRNVLQGMIEQGMFVRSSNVHQEVYFCK
jgi:hypothetical protein